MHRTALNTKFALIVLACLILNSCGDSKLKFSQCKSNKQKQTLGSKKQLSPKSKQVKKDWYELIHSASEGVDWREVEEQNLQDKIKARLLDEEIERQSGVVDISNGKLTGRWQELGPTNLPGDMKRVTYSPAQDQLFAISSGGTLWKGKVDGSSWEVVNDSYRFGHEVLEIAELFGSEFIYAMKDGKLQYSNDSNVWSDVSGLGSTPEVSYLFPMADGNVFVVAKPSPNATVGLYRSKVLMEGEPDESIDLKSFERIHPFQTTNLNEVAVAIASNKENMYAVKHDEDQGKIITYYWNPLTSEFLETGSFLNTYFALYPKENSKSRLAISTRVQGGDTYVKLTKSGDGKAVYSSEEIYQTNNPKFGTEWTAEQSLPQEAWWDSYSILSDQKTHIIGREQCYYSIEGSDWTLVNPYDEYYTDKENKLHIDIMQIKEFNRNNTKFVLICTHGGIYYTEDISQGVRNISRYDLNTAQFYDVVSIDGDPNWIIAGSQDQGWQRGRVNLFQEPDTFRQILSGDYGHLQLREDESMWLAYPNGAISYYPFALSPFTGDKDHPPAFTAQIKEPGDAVWISPMILHPDPAFGNTTIVAGGSINEGQEGSYLITIKETGATTFELNQLQKNFKIGNGEISAIETDSTAWYVATTNGYFFFSKDAGTTWIQTAATVPGAPLNDPISRYGTDILISKKNPETIYVAGSGYSSPGVLRSTDGGLSFSAFGTNLPQTTVFELAQNENENLIFAATEAGPYVYLKRTNKWYDLADGMAPEQAYWSVDFIEDIQTARFGTYGRGVWQFEIETFTSNKELANLNDLVNIYPNPTSDFLRLETEFFGNISHYEVLTLAGNFIFGGEITTLQNGSIPVSNLAQGAYLLRLRHKEGYIFKKFVKI